MLLSVIAVCLFAVCAAYYVCVCVLAVCPLECVYFILCVHAYCMGARYVYLASSTLHAYCLCVPK